MSYSSTSVFHTSIFLLKEAPRTGLNLPTFRVPREGFCLSMVTTAWVGVGGSFIDMRGSKGYGF